MPLNLRRWILVLLILGVSFVVVGGSTTFPPAPPRSPVAIRIRASTFEVGGKELRLGENISDWTRALGPESRVVKGLKDFYVWDELGLWAATAKLGSRVSEVEITLNLEDMSDKMVKERAPYAPRLAFPGKLIFDGFEVKPNTPFRRFKSGIDAGRDIRCGSHDCSHPHGSFGAHADLLLRLAGPSENDQILEIALAENDLLP